MSTLARWLTARKAMPLDSHSRTGRYRGERQRLTKIFYCCVESTIMAGTIYLVWFAYNPYPERFLAMNMHPLLIMVGLMALRYGNYLGVLSATIASLVYLYAHAYLGRDLVIFFTSWEYYKFLLMFYLTAVTLGTFRDYSDNKIAELGAQLSENKHDLGTLIEAQQKALFVNSELKKQIIGTEDSILSLYSLASALESLRPEVLYTELASVMAHFLRAQAVSIYTVDSDEQFLRLKVSLGHDVTPARSLRTLDFTYLTTVVSEKRAYRVSADSAPRDPVFSAPITKDGHVIAVVNVDKADFYMVTEYSFDLFKVIIEWVSKSLIRALEVEESLHENYYHPNSRLLKLVYFMERVAEEKRRLTKYGLPYSLLRLANGGQSHAVAGDGLSECLREVDVVGYDDQTDELVVLLPLTGARALDIVKERLQGCFGASILASEVVES